MTDNPNRKPGKFGRKPPKNAPALKLTPLLSGAVPDHPASQDNFTALAGGWNMLGNDEYGDCVAVTLANVRRLMTQGKSYMNLEQVIQFYKTQNPGFPNQDDGMDIQTALEYLVKNGGPDGTKALAFAKVDYTNPDEVKAAIAIFGYVWTGINVQNQNMNEFNNDAPWTWEPHGSIDGGHSVVTGGYGTPRSGPLGGDEDFITWAAETSFTDDYWAEGVEEAWVVIWPEHLSSTEFQQGISLAQLAADYTSLTGRPFPSPEPIPPTPPTPQPPAPTPQPPTANPDRDLQKAFRAWEREKGLD